MNLTEEIERIREFTRADAKLAACHHFCFDFRLGDFDRADYIVLGMNPGETDDDRSFPGPAEESSLIDYRSGVDSRSRKRWFDTCKAMVGTDRIALTELIFWSSPNIPALHQRLGDLTPYLLWCREENSRLLNHHQPRAVVAPGLGLMTAAVDLYSLRAVRSVANAKGHRLIEHWERDGTPWVFTKHWSGSFGFSGDERRQIREYLAAL